MTTGIGNAYTDSPHFSNLSSNGYANSSCLHSYRPHYVLNSVGIATGSNYSYKGEEAHPFSESCDGLGLSVFIPVAVSGLSFVPNEVSSLHPQCPRGNNSVWGVKIYSSFTGIPSCGDKIWLCIDRPYDSGLNISGENGQQIEINGDAVLMTMGGLALSGAAFLSPPTAGAAALASTGMGVSFVSGLSQMVNYVNTDTSKGNSSHPGVSTNTLLWNQMFVDNGIWKKDPASAYGCGNFSNAFSAQELLYMQIPQSDFSFSGYLHLEAQNIVSCSPYYYKCTQHGIPGATANLSLPIVPAYTIHGEVKGPNGGLANQKVLIKMIFPIADQTKCEAYVVNTNSAGDYRFFAKPGCQYNVSLCSDPAYHYCCSASETNNYNSSANRVFKVNPVEFSESGLPHGQVWSVDLNGDTVSTTSSSITFGVPNGTYSYTIKMPSSSGLKYTPSNPSGSITVSGSDVDVPIKFQLVSIVFHESGLNGNTWSVTLDGATISTSGSGISLPEPINNTYSYTIGVPRGYSVNPSSGSVSLGGLPHYRMAQYSIGLYICTNI